ncbi:hypothetical protein [Nocardiopsis halotolerans]|uniref:hypothetical protein n=1 Tax=Nocardiopsis halotolerans TaxID=124252 RepID=UPI00034DCDA5|nr:hypothetical protein [Nocardiopsis halotolerans]
MSTLIRNWCRAVVMVVAPALLLAALLYHPFLSGFGPNPEIVAQAVEADPTRWATVHLLTVWAFALFVLAFHGLRGRLRDAGEGRWSSWAFPLVIVGLVLIAALPAIELTVAAAVRTGADTVALLETLQPWFLSLLVSGSALFLVGSLAFAMGIARAGITGRSTTTVVVVAVVVMALAMAAPPFPAFYVMGIAAIVAFWPLAWATVRTGPKAVDGRGAEAGDTPAAPRPRAAEERGGVLRGFGRRGSRAHH